MDIKWNRNRKNKEKTNDAYVFQKKYVYNIKYTASKSIIKTFDAPPQTYITRIATAVL